ncbi:MAG TPA: FtsX-like permease family protein [Anaeromyxobacteraceae bacterium]|jgi:ABC-type lipoprotein release transport system permease subunit
MMLLLDVEIAVRNLLRHTRRNLFLGGALAATTALLLLLGGLAEGMKTSILKSAATLASGHVNVGGFFKITSGSAVPIVTEYPRVLEEARKHVPELDFATVRGRGFAKAVSERASMDLVLAGVDVGEERMLAGSLRVVQGDLAELTKPGTILLFEGQAKRLEVQVGDALTLAAPTTRGQNNTADVRIACIAKDAGLLSAFMTFIQNDTLRQLYQLRPGTTGAIHLYLKDPSQSAKVAARLRERLGEAGYRVMDADPHAYWEKLFQKLPSEDWTGQKIDLSTWEDEMNFMGWILSAVRVLTGILVFVLMVIVVVGILNTLAIAIRERTREIGTLRAIGMQRRKVRWLLLLEAGLLGAVGAGAGAALAGLLAAGINAAQIEVPESVQMFIVQHHLHVEVEAGAALRQALILAAVTTLASILPASWAARLQPVTAMHHIG